jgi:hypothetical protein
MAMVRPTLAVGIALFCLADSCRAQQEQLQRFERQLEQINRDTRLRIDTDIPVDQRTTLDYGGYLSFYFLTIDDGSTQNTHILRQTDLTGYARLSIDGVHQFFVRGRVTYRDFNSGDSFDGEGDEWVGPELERALYRFDLRRAIEAYEGRVVHYNVAITGGRQLVHWANGLVISRDIDGGVLDLEYGPAKLQIIAGRTREHQVDIDSSRPNFDEDMRRDFYGALLSAEVCRAFNPLLYGLVQIDQNQDDVLTVGGTTRFNYDSHYLGAGATGNLGNNVLYGFEAVYQGGEGLAFDTANPQTTEEIQAWALDVRGEYLLNDDHNTRFSAELVLASGDADRGHSTNTFAGNAPGTDDHAFNAFGLINTGLAFAPNVSNLWLTRLGGSTYPLPNNEWLRRLQVGVDLLIFNKLQADAAFDETTSTDTYLGIEPDFYVNWQATSDVAVTMRYGVFFPGAAVETDHSARHFFYTGVTLAF